MQMRSILLLILTAVIVWFLYMARAILTPFILAGIFAYLVSPLINILSEKTKVDRAFYVPLLFILILFLLGWGGTLLGKQIFTQAQAFGSETSVFLQNVQSQIPILPDWLQGPAHDALISMRQAFTLEPANILPIFSGAASRVVAFITFLFASFYFLKDGARIIDSILVFFPKNHKIEVEILLRKINAALSSYLRGQLSIVLLMAILGTILFTILDARFSLLLGITIGLAEIVPMIGPVVAAIIIFIVGTFDGGSKFALLPVYDGLLLMGVYVILNQLENYLIVPQIMGRATKLHPLLIFFAVLAGGNLFGLLGFMLAVPVAASLRILFEYLLDKLASK